MRQWRWPAAGRAPNSTATASLNLSLVLLLEIVGEAAGRVPAEERARHLDIPWPDIVGLRNRLIHGYEIRLTSTSYGGL